MDCKHDNVNWLSGEVGVIIPLNGDVFAECLDCGMVARSSEQVSVECPNHGGNFDCNPFCPLCEGEQEYEGGN
jgi:hypothetical protein